MGPGETDPVGGAKSAGRAGRTRVLCAPRRRNRAARKRSLSAATGDFAHPTRPFAELNTGDLQPVRRAAAMLLSISREVFASQAWSILSHAVILLAVSMMA